MELVAKTTWSLESCWVLVHPLLCSQIYKRTLSEASNTNKVQATQVQILPLTFANQVVYNWKYGLGLQQKKKETSPCMCTFTSGFPSPTFDEVLWAFWGPIVLVRWLLSHRMAESRQLGLHHVQNVRSATIAPNEGTSFTKIIIDNQFCKVDTYTYSSHLLRKFPWCCSRILAPQSLAGLLPGTSIRYNQLIPSLQMLVIGDAIPNHSSLSEHTVGYHWTTTRIKYLPSKHNQLMPCRRCLCDRKCIFPITVHSQNTCRTFSLDYYEFFRQVPTIKEQYTNSASRMLV